MVVEDTWNRGGQPTPRHGTGLRWRVRWRDWDGRQRAKSFRVRAQADAFDRDILARPPHDPAQDVTVGALLARWWATKQRLGPATLRDYEGLLVRHVRPVWGAVAAKDVTRTAVLEWALTMPTGAARARRALLVLRQALDLAVGDGVLERNPAAGVKVPDRSPKRRPVFLTPAQVRALLDVAGPHRPLVHLAVTAGPRWGELAGMDVADVDPGRRRARVERTASTIGSDVVLQDRTKRGRDRWVPLTRACLVDLEPLLRRPGGAPLFVTSHGNRWRYSSWKREWQGMRDRAGLPSAFRFHDLRHTAASLAIASGADVKQVQSMLGHATATMTLDLYGHLWEEHYADLGDRIGGVLDA